MKQHNKKAFSIIEILVWMFIFSLWILSVYALIMSSMNLNEYNKNYIIASNLAREQLELMRNIRDSNYVKIQRYNQINPWVTYDPTDPPDTFIMGSSYLIENNYSSSDFPISVRKFSDDTHELCLDPENRYVHDCWLLSWNKQTNFFKFITISEAIDSANLRINNAFKVTSTVIWYKRWKHEFEVDMIIADWKRL